MTLDFNRAMKVKLVEEVYRDPDMTRKLFADDAELLKYLDLYQPALEGIYLAAKTGDSQRFWSIFKRAIEGVNL